MNYLKISVIAILVIVVIVVVAMLWRASRRSDNSRRSSDDLSESNRSSNSSVGSDSNRFHANAARGQSRYTVTKGKLMEDEPQVQATAPQVQAQQPEFPRHAAQAGNRKDEQRFLAQQSSRAAAVENRFEVTAESSRVVNVARVADLFSVKRNIAAELGVSEEEENKMVEAYKKKSEYRERRLPVNQHFNLDDYKDSKKVMRESANASVSFKGSKRGTITGEVYKTYGKNATRNRNASNADVMSMEVDADRHEAHLAKIRERRANGFLEVRT